MTKSLYVWLLIFLVGGFSASFLAAAPNEGAGQQSAFGKIVQEYYRIHDALAQDTTQGIDAAAVNIAKLASQAHKQTEAQGPDFAAISRAAASLQGKNLEQARKSFFELSKPIIAELKRNPSLRTSAFAYTCTMANKSWVQADKQIRNPYYGKSMLKCGEPL